MSSDLAIKVERLSKSYQIYDRPRDRLLQMLFRGHRKYYREFWALRDVSFEVKKGETVGIIGRNGSGKSTLLQLICGTLNPSGGTIQTYGRMAALLELGSGFNPEFTGRENVYMNASVLGLQREEIDARFQQVTSFADIGEFIEQPVRTYSSGMMIRLAFAVAINVDPEILIVDEALSVGDELFQRKCFSRIEAIRASGATILFVSHSGASIVELCDRAVLLDAGENLAIGHPKQIVGRYQKLIYAPEDKRQAIREQLIKSSGAPVLVEPPANKYHTFLGAITGEQAESYDPHLQPESTLSYASQGAVIETPAILTLSGAQVNILCRGGNYHYTYTVQFFQSVCNVRFGMLIKTTSGIALGGGVSASSPRDACTYVRAGSVYRVEFYFHCALNPGIYFLNAGVVGDFDGQETYLHRLIDAAMFRVQPDADNLATGIVDFGCHPEVELLSS